MTEKVKLTGGPEKTVTWIWLENGQLKVEFYDFSEAAQKMFGNDIAYILTVNEMSKLYSLAKQDETSLIQWMTQNFKSYFGIKQWLEENGIGFNKEVDLWA
jgi:beta-glucosidase/6-phospho-beta-glucosidase/beta-galactosidase